MSGEKLITEQWVKGVQYRFTQDKDGQIKITKTKDLMDFFKEGWHGKVEANRPSFSRPMPCRRDEKGNTKYQSVKVLFSKIDEELNELKESVFGYHGAQIKLANMAEHESRLIDSAEREMIAEEAADTITAITTLLESLGIDEEMRLQAQERVNFKNGQRGRL